MSGVAIAEHAFLSDCRSSALVTRHGSVDWLCLPRFDSAPALGRLLDDDAGHLLLAPTDPTAVCARRYRPQSLVLETTWTSQGGQLQVQDALALGDRDRGHHLGRDSPGVLLRHARCISGGVAVHVSWAPRPEFGLVHPQLHPVREGLRTHGGATVLQLSTDLSFTVIGATATATVELSEGDELALALQQFGAWDAPGPGSTGPRHRDQRVQSLRRHVPVGRGRP